MGHKLCSPESSAAEGFRQGPPHPIFRATLSNSSSDKITPFQTVAPHLSHRDSSACSSRPPASSRLTPDAGISGFQRATPRNFCCHHKLHP